MRVTALAHVCIRAKDLEAAERFYVALLGFERQFRFTRKGKVIGFYLRLADRVFLEAFQADDAPPTSQAHTLGHFCLECVGIDALHARLADAGCAPGPLRLASDRTRQFWVKDPDGVPIEFQEYTSESAQFRTEDVEVNW